jgi:hypothetical protein
MGEWVPFAIQKTAQPNSYYVNSETTEGRVYQVILCGEVWKCTCRAYLREKLPCKHIAQLLEDLQEAGEVTTEEEAGPPLQGKPSVSSKWLKQIHGRDFILYEGLLAMAHERGLTELGGSFISVTENLALAYAWATFKDGRRFWESGDATPQNVNVKVKAHFPRIALTRAKARCLRDALNIGTVAVEELDEA